MTLSICNWIMSFVPLIGFLGPKSSGKGTSAEYLEKNYGYHVDYMATPLKKACKELFFFNDQQLYGSHKEIVDEFWGIRPRDAFQFVGTRVFRGIVNELIPGIGQDFFVRHFEERYVRDHHERTALEDLRMQNECDAIHSLGGVVVKVVRPGIQSDDTHISETSLHAITDYDFVVENREGDFDYLYRQLDVCVLKETYPNKFFSKSRDIEWPAL